MVDLTNEPFELPCCSACMRQFSYDEPTYSINVHAEYFARGGYIEVLFAESAIILCKACADRTTTYSLETPFVDLLRRFA